MMTEDLKQLILAKISDKEAQKAIFGGNPQPWEINGVQCVNFWLYSQEIDLYLIDPLTFKHKDTGGFFDNFDDLLQEIL